MLGGMPGSEILHGKEVNTYVAGYIIQQDYRRAEQA